MSWTIIPLSLSPALLNPGMSRWKTDHPSRRRIRSRIQILMARTQCKLHAFLFIHAIYITHTFCLSVENQPGPSPP